MTSSLSIIRYVPQPDRGEAVNVGVVAVDTALGYFAYHISTKGLVKRVRCLDPSLDVDRVKSSAEWFRDFQLDFEEAGSIEERREVLADIQRVMSSGLLQMGPQEPIVFEGGPTAADLDEVLAQSVAADTLWFKDAEVPKSQHPASFKLKVWDIMESTGLYKPNAHGNLVKRDHAVRINGHLIKFDMMFENGRPNVVEMADIRDVHSENSIIEKAAATIQRFRIVRDSAEMPMGRIALLNGSRSQGRQTSSTIRELVEIADDVYFMDEDQERRRFVTQVRKAVSHGLI